MTCTASLVYEIAVGMTGATVGAFGHLFAEIAVATVAQLHEPRRRAAIQAVIPFVAVAAECVRMLVVEIDCHAIRAAVQSELFVKRFLGCGYGVSTWVTDSVPDAHRKAFESYYRTLFSVG
jgi:hypothetical protein